MTSSVRLTRKQDFRIEVAENERVSTRTTCKVEFLPMSDAGPQTGIARPRCQYETVPTCKSSTVREKPTIPNNQRHPLKRLISTSAVFAGVAASLAFPVLAQDGTGAVPQNAEVRSYGGGWDCILGYRVEGVKCVPIDFPENAYATGRSYGSGWECKRGFVDVGRASCKAIPLPDNAFLRSSGYDWQCDRGYRRERETCVPIVLPDNAYLSDDTSGSGWTCERGFTASSGTCIPIAVPENGYLTNADYGDEWACERGFFEIDGRCDPIALPANAFLDTASYGPGWRCERGFEAVEGACAEIDIPPNAHLDRSGNRWRCDRGFHLSDGECALGR